MFAVIETTNGFNPITGYPYYRGDAMFQSGISSVINAYGGTLICLNSGKILCVNNTGGTGHNMFAVIETASGFNPITGYQHYRGDQYLSSPVKSALASNGLMMLGFLNGKMLKINGLGGSGHNQFAITETAAGFQGITYYPYFVGCANLGTSVTGLSSIDGYTFVGTGNGKLMKISGVGGSGYNMFAIVQRPNGFLSVCGYSYLAGSQGF